MRACTDWQLRPSGVERPLAVNDHTDKVWDQRVLNATVRAERQLKSLYLELGDQLTGPLGYDKLLRSCPQTCRRR